MGTSAGDRHWFRAQARRPSFNSLSLLRSVPHTLLHPSSPPSSSSVLYRLSFIVLYTYLSLPPKCRHAGVRATTSRQYSPTTSSSSPPSSPWYVTVSFRIILAHH